MLFLSTLPRFTRTTLVAGALALAALSAVQMPTCPSAPQRPLTVGHCPYQNQDVEEFGGVGLYVGSDPSHDNRFTVMAPLANSPAEVAGLQPGDVIVNIDGQPTGDMTAGQAVLMLRGQVGTDVHVDLYRPAAEKSFAVDMTRVLVRAPRVCP